MLLNVSPFIISLIVGLALGVASMLLGIDRHLARRRGRVAFLNMPTVAALLTVGGAVGYPIARYTSLHPGWIWLIATASGLAAAFGVFGLLAGYVVPAAARDVEDERYVLQGNLARATKRITPDHAGEIEYEENGAKVMLPAMPLGEHIIEAGTDVVIERIEEGTAHVEAWSIIAQELQLPA
jgi:hypothetical protein